MITLTGVGAVSFRNPDYAAKYSLDTGIIQRFTRGQKVIVYKDTNWKSIETEILAFQNIRSTKRQEIQDFIIANLGTEIVIAHPRAGNIGQSFHRYTGFIYSDIIDYTTSGSDGCQVLYVFGLVLLHKILPDNLEYLLAENGRQLISERGDIIKSEADL